MECHNGFEDCSFGVPKGPLRALRWDCFAYLNLLPLVPATFGPQQPMKHEGFKP